MHTEEQLKGKPGVQKVNVPVKQTVQQRRVGPQGEGTGRGKEKGPEGPPNAATGNRCGKQKSRQARSAGRHGKVMGLSKTHFVCLLVIASQKAEGGPTT